ncbi:hypothetical protein QCA50_014986 [Cerrena zonata]|uniref:Cytochrome P450 n=1 Tax=Cerrena zonata TaxID=2478898 RepID=A0AAW0FRW0_9APHY
MQTSLTVPLALVVIFVLKKIVDFRNAAQATKNLPGFRVVWDLFGVNEIMPRIRGIMFGGDSALQKHGDFARFGADIYSVVAAFPKVQTTLMIADADILKTITGSRLKFPKALETYGGLSFWGQNLVVSEGHEWKRFRKISAPAFSEPNNRLVWQETINVMQDLFDNVWGDKKEIVMDHALHLPFTIALFVIGAAGFGKRMSWNNVEAPPTGHKMHFQDAMEISSANVTTKALFPGWMVGLTKRGRNIQLAFEELEKYMLEMVTEGKMSRAAGNTRHDLFSKLLDASESDLTGEKKLTELEVISNIFIFLFAGHETTAHTLTFAFALLALYPDEQERLYEEIVKYLPGDKLPTYEEANSMTYLTAVINETLRMYPPVVAVPKRAAEDTTFVTTTHAGDRLSVPVPKGSILSLNFYALHYNPKYWENPHAFKPSRFLGDWPRDAFMPFSAGSRSCIGRRFAELESMVVLAMIVKNYKIAVKEEPQFAGETLEQRKERLFQVTFAITQAPVRVPLVFTKRV